MGSRRDVEIVKTTTPSGTLANKIGRPVTRSQSKDQIGEWNCCVCRTKLEGYQSLIDSSGRNDGYFQCTTCHSYLSLCSSAKTFCQALLGDSKDEGEKEKNVDPIQTFSLQQFDPIQTANNGRTGWLLTQPQTRSSGRKTRSSRKYCVTYDTAMKDLDLVTDLEVDHRPNQRNLLEEQVTTRVTTHVTTCVTTYCL